MASASLGDDGSCGCCARQRRLYIVLSSSANDTCSAASPAERLTSLKICRKGASSFSALRFKLALSCRRWLCSNWSLYVLISTQAWCFSCPSLSYPAMSCPAFSAPPTRDALIPTHTKQYISTTRWATQLNWTQLTQLNSVYSQVSRVFVYDVTTYKLSHLGHYVHWKTWVEFSWVQLSGVELCHYKHPFKESVGRLWRVCNTQVLTRLHRAI